MSESALTTSTSTSTTQLRQRGATAVEFALIFPLMFALLYGAIVYSFAFTLKQSITFAAQEAAEAAVGIQPGVPGYDDPISGPVATAARATARSIVLWMPANVRPNDEAIGVAFCADGGGGSAACPTVGDAVVVTVTLSLTGTSPLFASFTLPMIGTFPPLPATMTAQAVARI